MFSYETIGRACKHRMIVPAKAISDISQQTNSFQSLSLQVFFFNETRQIKLPDEGKEYLQ